MVIKHKHSRCNSLSKPQRAVELRGWPAIANFLGMPVSTVHRWKKEGMPVQRQGRSVVANPDELNQWLQRTSGEAAGVHVVTPGSDLEGSASVCRGSKRGDEILAKARECSCEARRERRNEEKKGAHGCDR